MITTAPPKHETPAEPAGSDTADTPRGLDPRIAAVIPPELIQSGEIIILLLKPSPWFIPLSQLRHLTTLALITAGCWYANEAFGTPLRSRDIVLLGIAAIGLTLFWAFFEWLSRIYIITDRRVITLSGVLRIVVFQAPLERIQHTTLVFSIRERLFGLGSLLFATAGTGFDETLWHMIPNPLEVHRQVLNILHRYRR
ncbi:MAG: PH domain-containing protein [Phycisphaeraceae bacterium]